MGEKHHLEIAVEATDPRILRSRRMLMEAFNKLLHQKDFDEMSIQGIAEEATLSRATFYLHYPDKEALLQAVIADHFRTLVTSRGLVFTDCDGALYAIALGVCDFLVMATTCPTPLTKMSLETSVIPVIEEMFEEGASHHELAPGINVTILASTAAWAVFGAARRWFQEPDRIPSEKMATIIEALVKPIFLTAALH